MTINWDKSDSEIDLIIENSAEATDEKLASSISSITRMTDEEVKELFPSPADVKKLTELMKIVKSSQNRNEKINNIVAKSEELGGVILSLLQKFA